MNWLSVLRQLLSYAEDNAMDFFNIVRCTLTIITSAKEVMFSSALVSLFVSRNTQKIFNRFSQNLV